MNTKIKSLDLDFGMYGVELKRIIKYLKQDYLDDWFQDPLLFEDKFNEDLIYKYFENNISNNNGVYMPTKRILLNLPKKHGSLRYSLETNFFDRLAFHAFGITIIQYFDDLLTNRVFNHRFNKKDFEKKRNRYLYFNSITQWKKFEEYVRIDAEESTILTTDIQNYYEHINLGLLKKILYEQLTNIKTSGKNKSIIRFCIDSICNCLSSWSFDGYTGLPQNRDISSFLANLYMHPIDDYMINAGYDYYRYMDDIRIICSDEFDARNALKILSKKLRKYHLTINGYKTEILKPKTKAHDKFITKDSLPLERIDSMVKTKKKQIVAIAYTEVKKGIEKCISKKEFDTREFRFYLNRISTIALCKDIAKPENYFDKIKRKILKEIANYPDNTDSFYKLLVSIDLSKTEVRKLYQYLIQTNKSIYSWQNYSIWKLLIHHKYRNRNLIKFAKTQIEKAEKTADICGALLYLGKFGSENDKKRLIRKFSDTDNFMVQRHYLIALQEMPYKKVKEISVKVRYDNKYTYKTLSKVSEHRYMTPPKTIPIHEIYNHVGFYA